MALSGSLNFLTASLTGSANIKVDFVGLNTLINEPIGVSSNTLGYADDVSSTTYHNNLIEQMSPASEPNQLNSLLLHRNGPYQHASWTQYRGADHPVAQPQSSYVPHPRVSKVQAHSVDKCQNDLVAKAGYGAGTLARKLLVSERCRHADSKSNLVGERSRRSTVTV